ncbi:MAG: apolipoprotein N-acyltransferase [Woeseiaceae bacterium]
MAYAPKLLTLPADHPRLSRLVCFALGASTTLCFEPFGLSYLLPLLLVPVLYVCMTVSPRDAGWHTFWYGFGLFLTGTYWIYISVVVFGQAPTWVALILMVGLTLIMSLWLFFAGWLTSRLAQGEPLQVIAVAPAAWVIVEWLRGWVLTGFPWLAFGYAHVDSAVAGYAPLFGVYGVSFAIVMTSAAILATLMSRGMGRARWASLAFVLVPWIVGGMLSWPEWTDEDGEPVDVTVLQAGVSQDRKWLPEVRQPTLDYYRDKSRNARSSEIVVWPEVAVPSLTSLEKAFMSQLDADARENGQMILFGILEDEEFRGVRHIYNSVLAVDGYRRQVYRKRHLVPFGEYFPVPAKVREWMKMMSLPHSDLSRGEDFPLLITTQDGIQLAVAICYEDAYASEQRYALPAAGILVNVSNDAWFGDSVAPHQHLQIARMRSLEFGRPTIRSTNTGISAFISYQGELLKTGPQHEETTLRSSVQPRSGSTPYAANGNIPVLGLCLIVLGLVWFRTRT